eukprot:759895-Hanusia_phi.AAC.1
MQGFRQFVSTPPPRQDCFPLHFISCSNSLTCCSSDLSAPTKIAWSFSHRSPSSCPPRPSPPRPSPPRPSPPRPSPPTPALTILPTQRMKSSFCSFLVDLSNSNSRSSSGPRGCGRSGASSESAFAASSLT